MTTDNSRFGSTIGFLDFLFNLVLTFIVIAVLLLLIVRTESSKPAVESKNEFVITVQWNDGTNDDVDVWVQDPNGRVISYLNKEEPGMHLQRDDVGRANKKVKLPDGTEREEPTNIEVVNITSWVPGQYNVNLHLYRPDTSPQLSDVPLLVTVKLTKINPYYEAQPVTTVFHRRTQHGAEITALNFQVGQRGELLGITQLPVMFALESKAARPQLGN